MVIASYLRRVAHGNSTPDEAKVVSAERAPIGLKKPSKGFLETVPRPHAPEVDGFAVRTTGGKEPDALPYHEPSTLAAPDGTG